MKPDKNKYMKTLPVIILLAIAVSISFMNVKSYYDEILNATGLVYADINKEVRAENEAALEDEMEYMSIIDSIKEQYFDEDVSDQSIEEEPIPSYQDKDLNLHASAALLLDAENERVLYEKNGYERMPMASTTKIMTCIVALENADLNGVVTVSSYAASMPDVQLNINKGQKFYLKDLLYSLMLESHNDVAVAIAEYIGGSVEGFAVMMNDKARTLGCEDTNFVTPNGLDAEGHYTTARDLAVIAGYAIRNKQFLQITNTSAHDFAEISKGKRYRVTNKNRFLYMMEGAIGVKTGFTGDAGYCFVGAVKRNEKTLISVVLGCGWPPNKNLKWTDTRELMNYGVDNYQERQIFQEIDFDPVLVKEGQQRFVNLIMKGDLRLLMRDDEKVKVVYNVPSSLTAPITANTKVGSAYYYIDGELYKKLPIYTDSDIARIDFNFCYKKILNMWGLRY